MSMSQEEIESLMNGLDFDEGESSEEQASEEDTNTGTMSEDDINNLIAETEDIVASNDDSSSEESVDELLNSLEDMSIDEPIVEDTNIDDILKELEDSTSNTQEETSDVSEEISLETSVEEVEEPVENVIEDNIEDVSNDNIDDLIASIDLEEDSEDKVEEDTETSVNVADLIREVEQENNNEIENIDKKIDSGVFPLPVEEDTKVVNQLSEVANDSEEKATKIFDVLSNILDYNNDIQGDVKALADFNEKQIAMLTSLSQKFPNIEAFNSNLEEAQNMGSHISDVNDKINNGNTEIFQAMELMQYHDINRQKIERVMSVIRKLSTYLNNLFEDEGNREEVAVANHIHGDNTEDLVGDEDLEALISEFNK